MIFNYQQNRLQGRFLKLCAIKGNPSFPEKKLGKFHILQPDKYSICTPHFISPNTARTMDILMGHIQYTSSMETGGGRCLNLNPYEYCVKNQ